MTDVTVNEDPLEITIAGDSPEITVTEHETSNTVVISPTPVVVTVADQHPEVIINSGVGGSIDTITILNILEGTLDTSFMEPGLAADLEKLRDLWERIGNNLLLTYPDGADIEEAGRLYTNQSITDAVVDMEITVDGKIDAKYSIIEQTAQSIDQRVTNLQRDVNGDFEALESRIYQTESSITSTVQQLNSADDDIELLGSSISQTAQNLNLEVIERVKTDEQVTEVKSEIAMLSDFIGLSVAKLDEFSNRLSAAELSIDPDGIQLEVVTQTMSELTYSLRTLQNIFNSRWGVEIQEDINGVTYASGFQLLTHPIWLSNEEYKVDQTVEYHDKIYRCILEHTATVANNPASDDAATYWVGIPGETKSSFTVKAEEFSILTPTGTKPLLVVNGDAVEINPDIALKADVFQSLNFGSALPGEPNFSLNRLTGQAVFNNITMSFGSGSTGYENLQDRPTSIGDISPTELAMLESGTQYLVYSWEGNESLSLQATEDVADTWIFDSEYPGGAIIRLEVSDDFEGALDISLNGEHLTIVNWDSGSLDDPVDAVIDTEQDGNPVDCGGLY